MDTANNRSQVINEFVLRRIVGSLAFLLPIVVGLGDPLFSDFVGLRGAISDYYHSTMRDYFVGTLCAVAVVLFCYKGHEKQDDIAGDIAALLALGTAFSPTTPEILPAGCGTEFCRTQFFGIVHFISAAGLFVILAYFSLFLFTKSSLNNRQLKADENTPKRRRNLIYRICGFLMIGCMAAVPIISTVPQLKFLETDLSIVFWLESVMLWAFGISWLTKSEIIFTDKK